MAAIFQTTFSNAYSWMKRYEFQSRLHCRLFPRVQLNFSIGADNGLVPTKGQAIIRTNVDMLNDAYMCLLVSMSYKLHNIYCAIFMNYCLLACQTFHGLYKTVKTQVRIILSVNNISFPVTWSETLMLGVDNRVWCLTVTHLFLSSMHDVYLSPSDCT